MPGLFFVRGILQERAPARRHTDTQTHRRTRTHSHPTDTHTVRTQAHTPRHNNIYAHTQRHTPRDTHILLVCIVVLALGAFACCAASRRFKHSFSFFELLVSWNIVSKLQWYNIWHKALRMD